MALYHSQKRSHMIKEILQETVKSKSVVPVKVHSNCNFHTTDTSIHVLPHFLKHFQCLILQIRNSLQVLKIDMVKFIYLKLNTCIEEKNLFFVCGRDREICPS